MAGSKQTTKLPELTATNIEGSYMQYKGIPLVRQENDLYLGDFSHQYVSHIFILMESDSDKYNFKIPSMVMLTVEDSITHKPVGRDFQKTFTSLKEALDYAEAWYIRCNSAKK